MHQQRSITSTHQWHPLTRVLHSLMALGILGQLILSLMMTEPDHLDQATALEKLAWQGHEFLGLTVVVVLLLQWIWLMLPSSDLSFSHFFPWSASGFKQISTDIAYIFKNRSLPLAEKNTGGLAGFIHGLGLLVATIMAASGVALYVVIAWGDGAGSDAFEAIAPIHGLVANLMWAYVIGHILAAVWHESRGERIIASMLRGKAPK